MSDIVERLNADFFWAGSAVPVNLCREAAAKITRLRAERDALREALAATEIASGNQQELLKAICAERDAAWNEAIEVAAKIADDWSHRGDVGVAMYAGSRIRDRILKQKRAVLSNAPVEAEHELIAKQLETARAQDADISATEVEFFRKLRADPEHGWRPFREIIKYGKRRFYWTYDVSLGEHDALVVAHVYDGDTDRFWNLQGDTLDLPAIELTPPPPPAAPEKGGE